MIANTAISSNYSFDFYLTKPEAERPTSKLDELRLTFKTPNGSLTESEIKDLNLAADYAKIYSEATNYARCNLVPLFSSPHFHPLFLLPPPVTSLTPVPTSATPSTWSRKPASS